VREVWTDATNFSSRPDLHARAYDSLRYNAARFNPSRMSLSTKPQNEMSWTKAVVIGLAVAAMLLVTLGFIPSIFRYWWASNSQTIVEPFLRDTLNIRFKDTYTLVRIHDAISMGYQTFAFAVPIAATYFILEKRRRRLGLRGAEPVKGYLPGK